MRSILTTAFLFLFFLIFSTGCKKPKRPYTIVFCDFTTSIDTLESARKIKKDALLILSATGKTSNVEYYSISKNIQSACLFKNIPLRAKPKPSDKIAYTLELSRQVDSLSKLLDFASSEASAADRREPNSCIIDCIERAIRYFRNYEPDSTTELHLYILSDMLECCTFSGNKKINLEPGNDIEKQLALIDSITDNSLSFREFKNLRIHIVVSTKKALEQNRKWYSQFWELVFKRYGYDIKQSISVELPVIKSENE